MSRPRTRAQLAAATRPYRRRLLELCYRMLGSVDAAHAQSAEVLDSLWRQRAQIPADGEVEELLLTLAVRACVARAEREGHHRQVVTVPLPPDARVVVAAQAPWVQPLPDPPPGAEGTPIGLDTVTALAHLSAVQRACVVLRYGLGWSSPRTAVALELSTFGAHSTTQRGRDAMRARLGRHSQPATAGLSSEDRAAALRYCRAVESADDRLVAECLRHDVIVTHQPGAAGNHEDRPHVLRGRDEVLAAWSPLLAADARVQARLQLVGSCAGRPVVLSSISAQGAPEFEPFALEVLGLHGSRVSELANFEPALARYFQ